MKKCILAVALLSVSSFSPAATINYNDLADMSVAIGAGSNGATALTVGVDNFVLHVEQSDSELGLLSGNTSTGMVGYRFKRESFSITPMVGATLSKLDYQSDNFTDSQGRDAFTVLDSDAITPAIGLQASYHFNKWSFVSVGITHTLIRPRHDVSSKTSSQEDDGRYYISSQSSQKVDGDHIFNSYVQLGFVF